VNDPPPVVAALQPLAEVLEALGVRYYVSGSVASSTHGVARSSLDADIVAELGHFFSGPRPTRPFVDIPKERGRDGRATPGRRTDEP